MIKSYILHIDIFKLVSDNAKQQNTFALMHTMRKQNITYTILSVTGEHVGHWEDYIFMHVLKHVLIANRNYFFFIVVLSYKQTFVQ